MASVCEAGAEPVGTWWAQGTRGFVCPGVAEEGERVAPALQPVRWEGPVPSPSLIWPILTQPWALLCQPSWYPLGASPGWAVGCRDVRQTLITRSSKAGRDSLSPNLTLPPLSSSLPSSSKPREQGRPWVTTRASS